MRAGSARREERRQKKKFGGRMASWLPSEKEAAIPEGETTMGLELARGSAYSCEQTCSTCCK